MTQNNRMWVLMSRRLSGEATPAEADELRQLLEHAPDKQYLFGVLHAYFTEHSSVVNGRPEEDGDIEERFRRIVDLPKAASETERETGIAPVREISPRRIW